MTDPGPPQLSANPPVWDRFALSLINDPRDLVFVHLIFGCTITALLGLSLFPLSMTVLDGPWFWAAAAGYLLIWAFWTLDRFILMLHCTSHRILFRREHAWLNHVIPNLIGPFFGETPQTYFAHHMGMHHAENNLADDLSSTMRFQRDRFGHWLRYFFRFLFLVIVELNLYFYRRGQTKMVVRALGGELAFWAVVASLAVFLDWRAALVVFVIPVLMVRTLMMAGNWAQHAFVDAAHPRIPTGIRSPASTLATTGAASTTGITSITTSRRAVIGASTRASSSATRRPTASMMRSCFAGSTSSSCGCS